MDVNIWTLIIGNLASVFTIAGSCFAFYKLYKIYQKNMASFYQGIWSNEGVVGQDPPSHFIEIKIDVDVEDMSMSGIIKNCRNTETNHEFNSVDILGNIQPFYHSKCTLVKSCATGMPSFGELVFNKINKNEIELIVTKEESWIKGSNLLPNRLHLFKINNIKT